MAELEVGSRRRVARHARSAGAGQGDAPQPDPHRGAAVERARLRRVTVEEICSEAGVGRTTFYLHFESKEQLLGSLAGATAAGVAADLDEAHDAASLDEQLDVLIRGISRRMQAVPKSLAQLVINSQRLGLMKAGPEVLASSTRFADLAREVLADARRRGELVRTRRPRGAGRDPRRAHDGRDRGVGGGAVPQVVDRGAALPLRAGGRPVPGAELTLRLPRASF